MRKHFYLTVLVILLFSAAKAQEPIHIGIIPFTPIDKGATATTNLAEDEVSTCFVNKGRFYLIDRSVTEHLKKELDAAKQNTSLYAKIVADQGRLAGAQYLITGKVGNLETSQNTSKNLMQKTSTYYHGTLRISLQINTVETGRVIFNEPFNIVSKDFDTESKSDMMDNILCKFKAAVLIKLRELLPSTIAIVKIEKKDKKDIPLELLINAGKEYFENGKNSNCDVLNTTSSTSMTSSVNAIKSVFGGKIYLDVLEVEDLTFGGTTSKREKKISELKISDVQGDFTVCTVSKGGKELKEAMDGKKQILIRQQNN